MAVQDLRARVIAHGPQMPTAGTRTVQYIDAKNKTHNATVLGSGTASGLKLYMSHYSPGNQVKDNVPAMVNASDTVCYVART